MASKFIIGNVQNSPPPGFTVGGKPLGFDRQNTRLDTGEYIPNSFYNRLSPEQKTLLKTQGIEKFNAEQDKVRAEFEAFSLVNTRLPDGKYVSNADLAKIKTETPDLYEIITTKGYDAYTEAYHPPYQPYPPNVNPWRRKGQFYWWTDAQLERVYGPKPPEGDPRWQLKGEYGSSGIAPIPESITDMKGVADYLYGNNGASPTGETSGTPAPVSEITPGSIPGFDVQGHAIPNFPASGRGVKYDMVINGVPYYQGKPSVDVPSEYLVNIDDYAVKTNTNEYVRKDVYDKLSPVEKVAIIERGVRQFNSDQQKKYVEFEKENVNVDGKWYSRAEWETLTPAQKQEVRETGKYTLPKDETNVSGVVIGASPSEGKVLVRLTNGQTAWFPGTPQQISEVEAYTNAGGTYEKRYVSPVEGMTYDVDGYETANREILSTVARLKDMPFNDINKLEVSDIKNMIKNGISPQLIVDAGGDYDKVVEAYNRLGNPPSHVDYINNYFKEKGWVGGVIPGQDVTLAVDADKQMQLWSSHYNEAKSAYEKEYTEVPSIIDQASDVLAEKPFDTPMSEDEWVDTDVFVDRFFETNGWPGAVNYRI